MSNEEERNQLIVVILLMMLFAILYLTGCSNVETKYLDPKSKPFVMHNGTSQCVAAPMSDFSPGGISRGTKYPDIYNSNGIYIFKCGLTPTEAVDYSEHLGRSLDYKP